MIVITATKFRAMRKEMGHSQKLIAQWFGVSEQSVARWEKSHTAIPGAAKILLWLLYDEKINNNKRAVRDYIKTKGIVLS